MSGMAGRSFSLRVQQSVGNEGESLVRRLGSCVLFYLALVLVGSYWVAGVLFILVFGGVMRLFLDKRGHRELGHRVLGGLFRGFFMILRGLRIVRIDDRSLRDFDGGGEPLIVASNHPSLWDALLLIRRFTRVSCVMKREILENPLLRSGAAFAGFIRNRPSLVMVRRATEVLEGGGSLLMFPEGTRTREKHGVLNPFRPGVALLAKSSGAGVLPVFIQTDSEFLRKGWSIWRCPSLPVRVEMGVGEVQRMRDGESVEDFSTRLEMYFRGDLEAK